MDLISSLLVWQDGQLVPASSASSQQCRVDADERAERDTATAGGSEKVRPSNVVNPQKRPLAHAHEHHETIKTSSRAKRRRSTKDSPSTNTETISRPSSPKPTPQTKLSHAKTYSLSTTAEDQHPQAYQQHDRLEHMPPPSARMACADVDMLRGGLLGGGHDLGLTHPSDYVEEDIFEDEPLQLESVADFEAANPFTPPPRKGVPRRLNQNNGVHTSTFWMACQDRGLKTEFNFREREQGCFYVSLKVHGQDLGEVGPYASKKDAKEAICKENLSKLEVFGNLKKRKSSGHQQEVLSLTPEGFEDENWIGVLNGYLQTHQLPPPEYAPSGTHPSMGPWFCTVRFHGSPLTPFGHAMGPFARKDEARKVAAMQAVHWLRKEGKLGQNANKRRKSETLPTTLAPGDTGLTQSVQGLDVKKADSPPRALAAKSAAQQVHDAALRLGFTQPAFPTQQLDGSFVFMWATFNPNDVRKEKRLEGEVCKVGPVYGKKTAKEECCRELLRLLDKIEQSRQTLI